MTWIVRVALERPLTFIVMALLILIMGPLAALNMPVDIFPAINIPVIGVVFNYTGLQASEISGRIITPFQRSLRWTFLSWLRKAASCRESSSTVSVGTRSAS